MNVNGGDDLESEDEYLNQNWHQNEDVEVAVDDSRKEVIERPPKKRNEPESGESSDDEEIVVSKKSKPTKSPRSLLLEAGKGIADADRDVQSAFLWTAFTHALKLKGEEIDIENFTAENFVESKEQIIINQQKYEKSMATYLKSGVLSSVKRMKKWKVEKSPMVIIVCTSALRAVAVLKEISSLNIRAAKLFAKHMNVSDQVSMLDNNSYPIAVGTPNRLLKLIQMDKDKNGNGALSLDSTELIVIDCAEDKKRFTVCTMNDTAPDMMQFIQEAVVPQLKKRKTIKFGMF